MKTILLYLVLSSGPGAPTIHATTDQQRCEAMSQQLSTAPGAAGYTCQTMVLPGSLRRVFGA